MSIQDSNTHKKSSGSLLKNLARFGMKAHVSLYRRTNGKIGGGPHLLILTTTGRKSGVERDTPLFYFNDGETFIIIASAGGSAKHPTWWLNLKSNPQAKIQVGANILSVTAREAEGDHRARLWSIIEQNYKQFVGYQKRTNRTIPVIVLSPTLA
ncbi:nitroreductase family deazaflavin-dependent oxidoreductase [Tengunoibacter tsumagoiensis]|uniref:Nitroreductase n=1 Tax=Tengunoibacter tsumagoiensis TaxID=2014871 RepID=A0A402AA22_9CHLR|nr:nitroreductase family deazaflavin-dependent oxidoreductase [Tengunoibacter tsumagoiensis]GCE15948.1 hypothetical protein KTT_58070 [Tengunoibacter tsumagoiensis]